MANFPETQFSMIARIREGDDEARREALGWFVEQYRPALLSFLVKVKNLDETDAEDLVNDFVLNKIIQGNVLSLANGEGRFRNALRVCLQRYLIDGARKAKRSPVDQAVQVDEKQLSEQSVDPIDRVWAVAVLTSAFRQLRNESSHWGLFRDRVLTIPPISYNEIIERHPYASPQAASNGLITAKRSFNRILENLLEAQSSIECEIDASGEELLRIALDDASIVEEAFAQTEASQVEVELSIVDSRYVASSIKVLDDDPNMSWSALELDDVFDHLLDLKLSHLLRQFRIIDPSNQEYLWLENSIDSNDTPTTTRELLVLEDARAYKELAVKMKEHFNKQGKSDSSVLPKRINVAMTFAMISRYLVDAGERREITSMSDHDLTQRLERLAGKSWINEDLRGIYQRALSVLLQ